MSCFKIITKDKTARAGILTTAHGNIETPIFMPVGTLGSVKALGPDDLSKTGAQVILGNTYHLYLRPGAKLIKKMGGLGKFMSWNGPILTDSGGFQAFSLGAMIEHGVRKTSSAKDQKSKDNIDRDSLVGKINEEGVQFVSHLDGSKHLLTPEKSIEVQLDLGSDICLVLDELLSPLHNADYVKESLSRTHRWELRSQDYFKKHLKKSINPKALLFGIVQGVYDREIRQEEAKWVAKQGFDGVSIGGSFGTSEYWGRESVDWAASQAIDQSMDWIVSNLPEDLPKHALGIGEVRDILESVSRGIDMFDCVAPTRRARNGSLYLSPQNGGKVENKFTLSISKAEFKEDKQPIDPGCKCFTCQNFSRSYLRHLYLSHELLYHRLASLHNVFFMLDLTRQIRQSIIEQKFSQLKKDWLKN